MHDNRLMRRRRWGGKFAVTFVGVVLALIFLFPFIIMVVGSFSGSVSGASGVFFWVPREFSLHNYITLFSRKSLTTWILNSLLYTLVPTAATLVTSLLLGYVFAKKSFKGKNFIFWLFLAMIMVPAQVLAVPRYTLFNQLGWIDTYAVMLVPNLWDISSLFFMRQYMQSIPKEIEEAATIDGCGQFRTVFRIIMPMCGPALASVAILRFVAHWNDFFNPLIFLTDETKFPLTVGLSTIMAESPPFSLTMAGAVISFLPTFLVFIFMQKYFIEGVSAGSVKE